MFKTVIVVISHQTPDEVSAMCRMWQDLNPEALVHLAYGGSAETFALQTWPERTFISDPRLRTRDHQRERQSYRGIMSEVLVALSDKSLARVLMVECDVVPLRTGLTDYLMTREHEESADVLGARLRRVDATGHPHMLAHEFNPAFGEWLAGSVRPEKGVVLMMLGCLTWWKWEAFKAVAEAQEPFPVYLELAMPTAAHMAGFRVRDLPEFYDDMEPLGELGHLIESRRQAGRWVLHPCKKVWNKPEA